MTNLFTRTLREPLLWFLLAGAVLFVVTGRAGERGAGGEIRVTDAERQRLHDQWLVQTGSPPTPVELERLVEQWIREEIYYREALALGLDEGDVIIRRRLVQKLAFLTEDLAAAAEPTADELAAYHARHADRYLQPARASFSHRYFSGQRREDPEAAARAALADPDDAGDPFMLQRTYAARSDAEIAELFGGDFAAALADLPTGEWQGPIRSAYGWHLVRIEERLPARAPALEEVAQRVRADLIQERRTAANEAFFESLRGRYRVVES